MDYLLVAGAILTVLSFGVLFWLFKSLPWMAAEDEKLIESHQKLVDSYSESKKALKREVFRGGFGRNIFKEKAKLKINEKEIDKIIAQAKKDFKKDAPNGTKLS